MLQIIHGKYFSQSENFVYLARILLFWTLFIWYVKIGKIHINWQLPELFITGIYTWNVPHIAGSWCSAFPLLCEVKTPHIVYYRESLLLAGNRSSKFKRYSNKTSSHKVSGHKMLATKWKAKNYLAKKLTVSTKHLAPKGLDK